MVKVIQGLNEGEFNLAGSSVGVVYESLRDAFNLGDSLGYVRGRVVAENRILKPGEILEFMPTWGRKGAIPLQGHIQQPFPYFGGKRTVAPEIWRRFGDVRNYVEPFFGGGGVLLNRSEGGPSNSKR